jgi:chromosome segregation ATPase
MSASASSAPAAVTTSAAPALQQRLSEQLEALSQVGETLTLRLLELEERLMAVERQLSAPPQSGQTSDNDDTMAMLSATEERIGRLEELLAEAASQQPTAGGTLHTLPLRQAEDQAHQADFSEAELELNPFPDEEEQPFMDELSA